MIDLILFIAYFAAFLAGVWVGATYGGLQSLYKKIRHALRDKLDDDKTQ